ncbi:RBBP8 N-terminal-like protein [Megalobrama amblycephala]|uniref:RBBP8 N-terminal-like protein n=1 Tax=Megalobrama amblycephala TaxID=75352 RepID=UPI0020141789|nr:RBBP8 N-terminal-like protein [Megalobrama amblycephala]
MAVESFSELLQKLREVHEHELEVWQEKVLELTNKKNIDTKRMEELYNRNQQMREQQRILTENIKQLENRLRAGLCDRCTVTQDVAKKRQQEYENSQIQSLQHISLLVSEMNALKKENDRLREELKGLKDPSNRQNGHSEDTITAEVKMSPDTAAAAVTLLTSGLKSSQPPPGDATVPAATVKRETDNSPTDSLEKASEHKLMHSWSRAFSFESKGMLPTSSPVRWGTEHGTERRAASVDSVEHRHSPLSPLIPSPLSLLKNNPIFSSTASEERSSRQQIHAPVPYRPLPIKSGRLSIPWSLSESSDWVAAASSAVSSGIAVNPSQSPFSSSNILRFPKLVPPSGGLQSRMHCSTPAGLRPWSRRNLSEHAESREKKVTEAVAAPPQWRVSAAQSERIFGENLREEEEDAPLDLSDSGRSKSQEREKTHSQSDASSSLSSSPRAALSSSSQCPSSPQSDQQTADNNTQQEEAQERCKEQEEVKEGETSSAAETSFSSENKKLPSLTISLQPVVVMEPLKSGGQVTDTGSRPMEQEEKENNNLETSRKRPGQDTDAIFQRSLKERKIRLSRGPQGNHAAPDQR